MIKMGENFGGEMHQIILFIVLLFITTTNSIESGPVIKATQGEIWPKPKFQEKSEDFLIVRNNLFTFKVTDNKCSLLSSTLLRYVALIYRSSLLQLRGRGSEQEKRNNISQSKPWLENEHFRGYLDKLDVSLLGECSGNEYPDETMEENYTLDVNSNTAKLTSTTIWGIMRGLESFSQIMYLNTNYLFLTVNITRIEDEPRFSYRGLMLDTSRHFIPKVLILTTLDAMSYNKLNVFHWHLTDDQSFSYESVRFPELSENGAYHPVSKIYTQNDVKDIIEYARQRGIRVIPEFDTPGHTRSWGNAKPDLLTSCYDGNTKTGELGPIDPSKEETYEFLQEFFEEIVTVFSDKYLHIGGDEVLSFCWSSNPAIVEFMNGLNITGNFVALEAYYVTKLINILSGMNANSIVWQDVFAANNNLKEGTIVNVWDKKTDYKEVLSQVTKAGIPAVLSTCYYLDYVGNWFDWIQHYICDPLNFDGTDEQKQLVIGGEVCMFTETVNEYNVISKVWPRACAAAEQFWSDINILYTQEELKVSEALKIVPIFDASARLEEHTCRLNNRGIGAQPPNLGGVCL